MRKSAMFAKLISSSFRQRRSRIAIALLAVVVGTAVISGLVSVYYDINVKMGKELRSYGANLVVTPASGNAANTVSQGEIERVASAFPKGNVIGYAPYLYGLAQAKEQRLVVVGTWFDQMPKINPYWQVDGAIPQQREAAGSALIGAAVATKLKLAVGSKLPLQDEVTGKKLEASVAAIITSGGTEDNQVFVDLSEAQRLFAQEKLVNAAYFSVMSGESEPDLAGISGRFPALALSPIKQISDSETVILDKIKSLVYLVVAIILLSTLLCVATTMMTMIMERKQEIALKKALGAHNKVLAMEFMSEGGVLGLSGALFGLVLGYLLAQVIGQSVFHSAISFRWATVPLIVLTSLGVTGIASLIPLKAVVDIEPAVALKGE